MKRLTALTIALFLLGTMSGQVKISELTTAGQLFPGDIFVVVQSGTTKSMSGSVLMEAVSDTADLLRYEFSNYTVDQGAHKSRTLYYESGVEYNTLIDTWEELMSYSTSIGDIELSYGHKLRIKAMVSPYVSGQDTYSARLTVSHEGVSIGTLSMSSLGEQDHVLFEFEVHYYSGYADVLMSAVSYFGSGSTLRRWHSLEQTASLTDPDELIDISLEGYGLSGEVGARLLSVEIITD